MLLVFMVAVSSCASSHRPSNVGGHSQPIVARDSFNTSDPCQDSLFLALQNKPLSTMTAYEHSYFQQKWNECNGTPEVNHGSTPEWILATLDIIGIVIGIIILAAG
jgi:hypothetical protein